MRPAKTSTPPMKLVLAALLSCVASSRGKVWPVFTDKEVAECGHIRIPELVWTPSQVLLIAQCRDANQTSPSLDDMVHAKVVTKTSKDNGTTWGDWTILTPISYSHGAGIYDATRKRVVLQYQYHPDVDPEQDSILFQRLSSDDGNTWGPPTDITAQLTGCNPSPKHRQVQSAGSKIQASSGRLVFTGHGDQGESCVWFSDDGGETYGTSGLFPGNEISVAEVSPGTLLLNGRGSQFPWAPNRTAYVSTDDGSTWGPGQPTPLVGINCEGALVALPGSGAQARLVFSEPVEKGRSRLVLRCSTDGGVTWPSALNVSGDSPAAYSALLPLGPDKLLVVWESGMGFLATQVDTKWCQ